MKIHSKTHKYVLTDIDTPKNGGKEMKFNAKIAKAVVAAVALMSSTMIGVLGRRMIMYEDLRFVTVCAIVGGFVAIAVSGWVWMMCDDDQVIA